MTEGQTDDGFPRFHAVVPPTGRACAAGAPISSRRNGGKEGPGGFAHPGPPNTGAHGGGALCLVCKDQPRIAARFIDSHVTGAAAPWEARIGITLQALRVTALYRLGPPGRRRNVTCRTAWGVHPIGGSRSSPLIGRFKGWVQGGGNRNPPPCPFFPPTFFGKKVGPPEAGASMGRADDIRPYRRRVKDAAPYDSSSLRLSSATRVASITNCEKLQSVP